MGEIVIAALATYGLSSLVAYQDGLYDVFLKLRQKYPNSAFVCPVCLSLWVAVPFSILTWLGLTWLLLPIAIVGVVIILEKL